MAAFTPLRTKVVDSNQQLECDCCGAFVSEVAEFRDERDEVIGLCEECEDDVLDELDEIAQEKAQR